MHCLHVRKQKTDHRTSPVRSAVFGRTDFGGSAEARTTPLFRSTHDPYQFFAIPHAPGGIQAKLTISKPGDIYEQEADHIADKVMRMPEPNLQRACACGGTCPGCQAKDLESDEEIQTKRLQGNASGQIAAPFGISELGTTSGRRLDRGMRSFMESRFGHDFSRVQIHTDNKAAQMNDALGARAFTYGSNIYFNHGEYKTSSMEGRRLLAHELTHVIQQCGSVNQKLQRECSDSTFCTPYTSAAEITAARNYLLNTFIPVLETFFGSDVGGLWRRYLSRRPGNSLTPVVFNREGNSIHDAFSTSGAIADETDNVLDLVASRLSRGYGNVTQPITNFISTSEMDLNTNFGNPFTIPGNIAGGIGSSDAGMDHRKITWGQVSFDITNLPFGRKLVDIEAVLGFEVKDAIDFCPGDCGAIFEQQLATIKLSRLEASGEAYDVPYIVRFTGPRRSKRVID